MTTPVESTDPFATPDDSDRRDGGFVLITFGLLLIPIVVFTALAVDVSSWYSRATELQRTADAAALAGTVWMPDQPRAEGAATPVLARNDVVDGTDDMSVTMGVGASGSSSFKVCVTDDKVAQFFGVVFAGPTSMTRCATAMFNKPLQLGSPLNYFGGNTDLVHYLPGTPAANRDEPTPDPSVFQNGSGSWTWSRCQVRDSYPGGTPRGYWNREGYTNPADWRYYTENNASGFPLCDTLPPAVPDQGSFGGTRYCRVVDGGGTTVGYWWQYNTSKPYPDGWRYRRHSTSSSRPVCGYGGTSYNPVPSQKSPGMWATVLGPDNSRANGDIFSTTNGDYRPEGYWYAVDIPDSGVSGPVSIQVFDGSTNCDADCTTLGDRTAMGDSSGGPDMYFAVWDAGATPYDTGDDTKLCDATVNDDPSDKSWNVRWKELCPIGAPPAGHRYYINVRSTADGGYNGYALRTVATGSGSYPTDCTAAQPANPLDCYGFGTQPKLSAYGDMEMFNGIKSGTPTKFFLANVTEDYAGKTLRIRLWDAGDGNGDISVQILKPSPPATGTPEPGVPVPECDWEKTTASGNVVSSPSGSSGGTLNGSEGCKLLMTDGDTMRFQDRWAVIEMPIPSDYTCDDTVDPTQDSGSCWWQVKYETTLDTRDYTTWEASIVGDPVRLTM